ncbi:GWT1-domain-containing protein [Melampsora americana]|nr:GWT1-domain-containing protein [Melampsora americana]
MEYKSTKESFVSGGQGCSMIDVLAVAITALLTYFIWSLVNSRLTSRQTSQFIFLLVEFFLLTTPLLLAITIFSHHLWTFNVVLALLSWLISSTPPSPQVFLPHSRPKASAAACDLQKAESLTPRSKSSSSDYTFKDLNLNHSQPVPANLLHRRHSAKPPEPSDLSKTTDSPNLMPSKRPEIKFHQGFVTLYRAQMMLLTVLSILAVDFPVFPRKFGKTEHTGVSLMDLGVGSFVFSLGIVGALPVLKGALTQQSFWVEVWNGARKMVPLVLLGVIRTILVKGVDYPEHVTEYGVHWNFFFTLAILPMIGVAARRLMTVSHLGFASLGLLLGIFHQLMLSYAGVENYVLSDAPRNGLISANREGISSLAGYGVLYLLGLDTGCYVLPPHPDYLKKGRTQTRAGKRATVLASWGIIWWTLVFLLGRPCRRTANGPYCAWVAAMNVFLLLGYELMGGSLPETYEAVNRNSLAVFLAANLLTGLVNVSIKTVFVTDARISLLLLEFYLAVVIVIAWLAREHKLKL